MGFAHPNYLWLLLLAGSLVPWMVSRRRRRSVRWRSLGQDSRLRPDGLLGWLCAMVCLVVALSQPRWGRYAGPPLPPGHDVVLVVDVSRSMGARDAVPDRLGLATETAISLVRALGREAGSRAGVVVFAGQGRVRCPLTGNLGAVVDVLRSLRPGEVQPGGTDLGAALGVGAEAFDQTEHAEGRTIVLFSDGEDHAETWSAEVDSLRASRVMVHTVAIGDAERGQNVPSGRGTSLLRYRGAPVVSRRNDAPLETIARETGGAFLRLGLSPADLGQLYHDKIAPVARRQRDALHPTEQTERYSWFVLAALCLLARGSWPGSRFPARQRWLAFAGLLLLAGATPAETDRDRALTNGNADFAAGRLPEALREFERAGALDTKSAVASYNAAASLFRLERYAEAYARYNAARALAGPRLRTKIDYALGNTALALGDVAAAVRHYDACLASTVTGGSLDAVRRDAGVNRSYAQALPRPPQPQPERDPSAPPKSHGPGERGNGEDPSHEPQKGGAVERPDEEPPSTGQSGNAGGQGSSSGQTPQERLDNALKNIRAESDRRRIPEEPAHAPDVDRKDW
ncbi:MAG: VWA domain-containing protein [Isosphaeraceae bacterium]|nr:VWA domain-containing protein [Isosphaeraceae bacterium]